MPFWSCQRFKVSNGEIILTPASEGTAGARVKLKEILKDNPGYFYVGQHVNQANPKAHYLTTGPELWADTGGKIDILVAGLGTGGTLCGSGRYLKEQNPEVQLIAVEPENSDDFFLVSEGDAFDTCRRIASQEGLLVGITSGATAYAAEQLAKQPENEGKVIVCIFADTGERYMSVEGLF